MLESLDPYRQFSFGLIIENAAEHLRLGLDLISDPRLVSDRSAPILSMLSIGVEHLLKATYIAAIATRDQRLLTEGELRKGFGHRILDLHETTLSEARRFSRNRASSSVASIDVTLRWRDEDVEWMQSSDQLVRLLAALDTFGAAGRYVDFAVLLTSSDAAGTDPKKAWDDALYDHWKHHRGEDEYLAALGAGPAALIDFTKDRDQEAAELARTTLAYYLRGVSRWWWGGLLGPTARSWSVALKPFLMARLPTTAPP